MLESLSTSDDSLLELSEADSIVSVAERLDFGKTVDLILRETGLQTLEARDELGLTEAARPTLGLFFTPLVEQAFVGQRFLDYHAMDLYVSLV